MSKQRLCDKAVAYLRKKSLEIENDLVVVDYNDNFEIIFLIDEDRQVPRYITNKNLSDEGVSTEELRKIGLNNVIKMVNEDMKIQEFNDDVIAVMLDGIVDTSLIFIDPIWEMILDEYVTNGFAIALPTREMLVFCDSKSEKGLEVLKTIINNAKEDEEKLLSETIFIRDENTWKEL